MGGLFVIKTTADDKSIQIDEGKYISLEKLYKYIPKELFEELVDNEKINRLSDMIENIIRTQHKNYNINRNLLIKSIKTLNKSESDYKKFIYKEKNYYWTGEQWIDENYMVVPLVIVEKLNSLLEQELSKEDKDVNNLYKLIKRAKNAKNNEQFERAEKLSKKILSIEPGNLSAYAVLCSSLRRKGFPEEALQKTEEYRNSNSVPLLTSRAAALCDIGKWERAKNVIGKALALGGSGEAFAVVNRIKKERPDLY